MPEESIEEKKKKTQSKLDSITNLPSIPRVVLEVSKILKDGSKSAVELANAIGRDQGITARILSISNSPFYGLQRQVSSLEFAIIVLGLNEVGRLVTSVALSNAVKVKSTEHFKFEEFWNHSLMVGMASKELCRHFGLMELSADAFVGGMLHDLGIQLLIKYFNKEFELIVQQANYTGEKFVDLEFQILGLTHQEMGKYLAAKWNLPEDLCNIIGYHHNPGFADNSKKLVSIVHLTDYMCEKLNTAPLFWDKEMILDKSVVDTLGFVSEEELDQFIIDHNTQFFENEKAIQSL